jgi:hypothetical protein
VPCRWWSPSSSLAAPKVVTSNNVTSRPRETTKVFTSNDVSTIKLGKTLVQCHDLLSQEQAQQLRMMCHVCLDRLGGNGVLIDEDDNPSTCRLCLVGDCLVIADFAADPGRSRFRQIDRFMVEAGGGRFRLDPRQGAGVVQGDALRIAARLASRDRPPDGAVVRARHGADAGSVAAGDRPDRAGRSFFDTSLTDVTACGDNRKSQSDQSAWP